MTATATPPLTATDHHIEQLDRDGYVLIPDAIPPEMLAPIRQRFDELMVRRIEEVRKTNPNPLHVEVRRILEQDPVFEQLMDHPAHFEVARRAIGADVTLATGGEADYRLPHTPAYISWHNDFQWMVNMPYPRQMFWVRCTYFLEDVTEEKAPFTLLPGTHRAAHACPADYTLPNGQPREIPGMVRVTGKAGSCLINNTEIWHTNTPNNSDLPRKLIMLIYKHAWMKQWEDGYDVTREFAERQATPLRRQLCGLGKWHRDDGKWDA